MRIVSSAQYDLMAARAATTDILALEVERLTAQVKKLEQQVDRERARAERAIDAQLAVRGFPTVTPREGMPDIPDGLDEDPEKVAELEKRLLQGDATVFTEPR